MKWRRTDLSPAPERRAGSVSGRLAAVVGFCAVFGAYPFINDAIKPIAADPAAWQHASKALKFMSTLAGGTSDDTNASASPIAVAHKSSATAGVTAALVDGDTISVKGERIRLLEIDAPVSYQSRCENESRLALKTKERLRALLTSGPLRVERQGRDRYGLTPAHVYAGSVNVGQRLLSEGYALSYEPGAEAKEGMVRTCRATIELNERGGLMRGWNSFT